jgi:hypothetical protein
MSGKTKHLFLNVHRHLLYRVLYKRTNGSTPSASASRSDFSLYCISRETGHLLDFFPPPIRGISDLGRGHVFVSVVPPKITAGGEVRGRIDTSPRSQQMMMERLHHHRRRNDLFTPPPPKRECTAECGGPSVVTTS